MKIKWTIEGGCNYAQCGMNDFYIDIPDDEFEELTEAQRDNVIDDYVSGEFDRTFSTVWEIVP